MPIAHQYDASGYYAGAVEDYGLLPNNATYVAPEEQAGYVPRWTGQAWDQVEDHKGREGFVNGEPFTVKEYGPLPEGWNDGAPPPSLEDAKNTARQALRTKRKEIEYGGFELNGQHWDSSEKDELRLNSVSRIFEKGLSKYDGWKISENVYVTLTPELVDEAAQAFLHHYGKCFAVEEAKLAEIDALTDAKAVLAWQNEQLDKGW